MSKETPRPESQEIIREGREQEKLFDRVAQIVRLVAGNPGLHITAELSEEEQAELIRQGQDPDKTWFRSSRHDPKTGKVVGREFVHVPIKELEKIPEEHALGIGAHEGAHARMTRFGAFVTPEMMQEVGLSTALHATEERPTDMTVCRLFPGAGEWLADSRRHQVVEGEENLRILGEQKTKRIPRNIELGHCIVFAPYEEEETKRAGRYGKQARESYLKIQEAVERIENTIPASINVPEKEIMALAKERFLIVKKEIWPEMKQIVELDRKDAAVRELLEIFLPSFLGELLSAKELETRRCMAKNEPNPLTALEENLQKELSYLGIQVADDLKREEKYLEETLMQEHLLAPEKEVDLGLLEDFQKEKEPERAWRVEERMSEELKTALKKLFESLRARIQRVIHEAVEQWLKNMEDEFVKTIRGGPAPYPTETHKEQEIREKKEFEKRRPSSQTAEEKKEREDHERKENLAVYEKAYREVCVHDEELYRELEEIFQPNKKRGVVLRSSGERLNLPALFRWKSARAAGATVLNNNIFETIKTPETRDYCFTILVDLSGSMANYGKIQETFKAVVLLTEVLNRLDVPFEILGFHRKIISFKSFEEPLIDGVRSMMGAMQQETKTNDANWNDDAIALREASTHLDGQGNAEKFLLIFSDGQPATARTDPLFSDLEPLNYQWQNRELERVVQEILSSTNQHVVGLGLGQGTEHVKRFYPVSLPNIQVKEMVEKIGALLKDMILFPERYRSGGE